MPEATATRLHTWRSMLGDSSPFRLSMDNLGPTKKALGEKATASACIGEEYGTHLAPPHASRQLLRCAQLGGGLG